MDQKLSRYRGDTLDEAYAEMRRALGPDAIVLRTAFVREGGLRGFLGKKRVELTATHADAPGTSDRRKSPMERKYSAQMSGPDSKIGSDERVADSVAHFQRMLTDARPRVGSGRTFSPSMRGNAAIAVDDSPMVRALRSEIREMRSLMEVLVAESSSETAAPEYAPQYRMLVESGVSREAAASLLAHVARTSDADVIRRPEVFQQRIHNEIQKRVSVTGGVRVRLGTCRKVALVGPTGVGKTTSIAKMAARLAVHSRARVALITADTYRVAAPDQLRVYANIIGVPLHVVHDSREMADAILAVKDYDLVLIDTAGGSPFNTTQIGELGQVLHAAYLDEVMLVLAANTRVEDMRHAVTHFGALRPTSILFSKLDETTSYGAIYTMAEDTDLPLSYFSTGQSVPEDFVAAKPETVAGLLFDGTKTMAALTREP
ncbi:MAG: hypothetical protein AMXMBFR84_11630 [Candidatus Hydrogenedentota bacterium]